MGLGLSDGVVLGIISLIGTALVALFSGLFKSREIAMGGGVSTQTQFYKDLMERVKALELQVAELRTERDSTRAELYEAKLKIQELTFKHTHED